MQLGEGLSCPKRLNDVAEINAAGVVGQPSRRFVSFRIFPKGTTLARDVFFTASAGDAN